MDKVLDKVGYFEFMSGISKHVEQMRTMALVSSLNFLNLPQFL